jgi:hypothetical protein
MVLLQEGSMVSISSSLKVENLANDRAKLDDDCG